MKTTSASYAVGAGTMAIAAAVAAAASAPAIVTVAVALVSATLAGTTWRARAREAREAEEAVAVLAHELKTPLTAVVGFLEVLDDAGFVELDADERDELIAMARHEAALLDRQISNLHVASRLARRALNAARQPVNLRSVVVASVAQFPEAAGRTFVGPSSGTAVLGEPGLIRQIVTNLAQNSQRYAPTGSVEIEFERVGETVRMFFSDDGPGIPEAEWDGVFGRGSSDRGLGLGLALSRELARSMGGDLTVVEPRRTGATFRLDLPHTVLQPGGQSPEPEESENRALTPRARLLLDITEALTERSVDRMVARLEKLYSGLLGAEGGLLMAVDAAGGLSPAGSFGIDGGGPIPDKDPILTAVVDDMVPSSFAQLPEDSPWRKALGGAVALFLPVIDGDVVIGVLAIGWAESRGLPTGGAYDVAVALADLAALAISRSSLAADVVFERGLRASVLESLPIAISVFAGDPPEVIDMNRRERTMLGLGADDVRPPNLAESQKEYEVRFADGTPLTVDTAPVTRAIRSGKSEGPFLLLVQRADGTEVVTRTYCAPFFDEEGAVTGAVVTSEEIDGPTRQG